MYPMVIKTERVPPSQDLANACHFLTYGEGKEAVSLAEKLMHGTPVVVALDPYLGELSVPLDVGTDTPIQAVCYHSHGAEEAYSTPRYIDSYSKVTPRTFLLLCYDGIAYTGYLCLSYADQLVSICGGPQLTLKAVSGSTRLANQRRWAMVCQRGPEVHALLESIMRLALQLTGGQGKLYNEKVAIPSWLFSLGWTSKLCCGSHPSSETILGAVRDLHDQGFALGYVVIEEGWQQLAYNPKDRLMRPCLSGFDADAKRFPNGLKGLVGGLRDLGVHRVGVWHGLMGSRNGIHPDIARNYSLPPDDQGRFFLGYDLGKTFEFFYDYYAHLRKQGITFVKVGDQLSSHSFCRSGMDVTRLHKNLQIALQGAASTHFTAAHLNADCLHAENLWYWPTSNIARAADDLDLANPVGVLRAIRNNLANGVWLKQLMLPDFDAWLTDAGEILAIFHALSGGPLQIGDGAGENHSQLLHKLALPSGKVFTADQPLTLCSDSLFINPLEEKHAYKAFTFKGTAGIIAAFNLCTGHRTVHGTVSASNIEGLEGNRFAVLSHRHGFVGAVERHTPIAMNLRPREADVFTFVPIIDGIAVIGCHSFFLSPGPITEVVIEDQSVHISSLIAASLLVYCERQVLEVRRHNEVVPWEYDSRRCLLSIDTRLHIEESPSIYSITFE